MVEGEWERVGKERFKKNRYCEKERRRRALGKDIKK